MKTSVLSLLLACLCLSTAIHRICSASDDNESEDLITDVSEGEDGPKAEKASEKSEETSEAKPGTKPQLKKYWRKGPEDGETEVTFQAPTPGEVEKMVNRLPEVFDQTFRKELGRALSKDDVPTLAEGERDSKEGGLQVDLNNVSPPAPAPKETIRERLIERYVFEVPSSNTRFIFVERSRPDGPNAEPKKTEEPESKKVAAAPADSKAQASVGAMPTIIRSRSSEIPDWNLTTQAGPVLDTARAERGFRALNSYLNSLTGSAQGSETVPAGTARPSNPREAKAPGWRD